MSTANQNSGAQGQPVKRGPGRPRKDGTPAQPRNRQPVASPSGGGPTIFQHVSGGQPQGGNMPQATPQLMNMFQQMAKALGVNVQIPGQKRRGRPPKQQVQAQPNGNGSAPQPPKREVGRPRKHPIEAQAETQQPKRGPGRPPKTAQDIRSQLPMMSENIMRIHNNAQKTLTAPEIGILMAHLDLTRVEKSVGEAPTHLEVGQRVKIVGGKPNLFDKFGRVQEFSRNNARIQLEQGGQTVKVNMVDIRIARGRAPASAFQPVAAIQQTPPTGKRRGRPPGSKNKPKNVEQPQPEPTAGNAEQPRNILDTTAPTAPAPQPSASEADPERDAIQAEGNANNK